MESEEPQQLSFDSICKKLHRFLRLTGTPPRHVNSPTKFPDGAFFMRGIRQSSTNQLEVNTLYYGDNLDNPRRLRDETIDLCYIDPPFNSKRNYNQIYNNIGGEDRAQAQAFTDTWLCDDQADEGFQEIIGNEWRTVEIHRVLKPTVSFYARLFDPVPQRQRRTKGRPRLVGKRLPSLQQILTNPRTDWQGLKLGHRYSDGPPLVETTSGAAVWYHRGRFPLPIS
jgi:hypothetical protein